MRFLQPRWLLGLLPVPGFAGACVWRQKHRRAVAVGFSNVELLRAVAPGGLAWRRQCPPPRRGSRCWPWSRPWPPLRGHATAVGAGHHHHPHHRRVPVHEGHRMSIRAGSRPRRTSSRACGLFHVPIHGSCWTRRSRRSVRCWAAVVKSLSSWRMTSPRCAATAQMSKSTQDSAR